MAGFSGLSRSKKLKATQMLKLGTRLAADSIRYTSHRKLGFPITLPKITRISVTHLCDSRCTACNLWDFYRKNPKKLKEEMTFEEFKIFVDRNPFLEDIGLTGGQVTLRNDIVDMWLYLDKKGYRTGGATNCVNLKRVISVHEDTLKKLSGRHTHLILISIDGIGKEHDMVRGIPGDFKNSMKFLKWCQEMQKRFPFLDLSVSHTITKSNYRNYPSFIEYMMKQGLTIKQLSPRPAVIASRYENLESEEILTRGDIGEMIRILDSVRTRHKALDNQFTRGMIRYLKNPKELAIPCYAGYAVFNIDPYWDVYACMDSSTYMGCLRETGFRIEPIWRGSKGKKVLMNVKEGRCHNCWNPCFTGPSMIYNPLNLCKVAVENIFPRKG